MHSNLLFRRPFTPAFQKQFDEPHSDARADTNYIVIGNGRNEVGDSPPLQASDASNLLFPASSSAGVPKTV